MPISLNGDWFAVQTRPGAEAIAAQAIDSAGIETFLPRARFAGSKRHRAVFYVKPLFPGYCFAYFQPLLHLRAIRYARGVIRVVGTEMTPWPVEESIIKDIRLRFNDEGVVELAQRTFKKGDAVSLSGGPLEGWTGVFDSELEDGFRVVILLHAIQQARAVVSRESVVLAEAV